MLKKFSLCCLLFLGACDNIFQNDYLDKNQYDIEYEDTYNVLIYDTQNSIVLSLLHVKQFEPDQFGQIEKIRKKYPEAVWDAELRASFLKGSINLPEVKKQVIKILQEHGVSMFSPAMQPQKANAAIRYYNVQIANVLKNHTPETLLYLDDALIDYYLFHPQIDNSVFDKDAPLPMKNAAKLIAISRFDNQKWHEKISKCIRRRSKLLMSPNIGLNIRFCASGYDKVVTKEAQKAFRQLLPYRRFYENLMPVPDAKNMKQIFSKDGKHFMWMPTNQTAN